MWKELEMKRELIPVDIAKLAPEIQICMKMTT
jgi:hypothetical protein